jgi:flagellin
MGMVTINSNYAAAFASNAAKQTSAGLDKAMEKLSTGSRINYARDDAAGQAIATRLTSEIQGLAAASRNAADGQGMLDTADGALGETHTLLLRMREISVQASNGTLQAADRTSLNAEFQQLNAEIGRIAANTSWAGNKLLDGSLSDANAASFHVGTGTGAADKISASIAAMSHSALGVDDETVLTVGAASAAIVAVDAAISTVSEQRGKLGAVSNRLDSTVANLDQVRVNLSGSRGRIEDTDFAEESGNLARNQILQQASTAMVAQANASKGTVLTLIQN